MQDKEILLILESGLQLEAHAECLSRFIWRMLDDMAKDRKENNVVLGGIDNNSMGPDISSEMGNLMDKSGFRSIWGRTSDES